MTEPKGQADLEDRSIGELVSRLSEQISRLARDELQLARAELEQKGKRAGVGAGMTGAAGLLAVLGLATLVAAGVAALALVLAVWAAALIVGGAVLVVAGLLALMGFNQVKRAVPPAPEQAIASTKRDIETIKESAHR
ncbi:MAG: phage holin family protein [Pseudonocardiaceae bacterium]